MKEIEVIERFFKDCNENEFDSETVAGIIINIVKEFAMGSSDNDQARALYEIMFIANEASEHVMSDDDDDLSPDQSDEIEPIAVQ